MLDIVCRFRLPFNVVNIIKSQRAAAPQKHMYIFIVFLLARCLKVVEVNLLAKHYVGCYVVKKRA